MLRGDFNAGEGREYIFQTSKWEQEFILCATLGSQDGENFSVVLLGCDLMWALTVSVWYRARRPMHCDHF
jgi:hypothetical protein